MVVTGSGVNQVRQEMPWVYMNSRLCNQVSATWQQPPDWCTRLRIPRKSLFLFLLLKCELVKRPTLIIESLSLLQRLEKVGKL
jgi:hypothetical protein